MIEPLRITFDVACPPERTFELWTARITTWWPTTHTVSAAPGVEIIIEPGIGGRIYERTPQGQKHDSGPGHPLGAPRPHRIPLGTFAKTAPTPPKSRLSLRPPRATGRPYRSSTAGGKGLALVVQNAVKPTSAAGPAYFPDSKPPPLTRCLGRTVGMPDGRRSLGNRRKQP